MKISTLKRLLIASTFVVSGLSNASLLTSEAGYMGPSLDLSAYENGSYNFTFGPEFLPGGITFTANPGGGGNSGLGSVIGQGGYGLGANGGFGGDAVYIGVDSNTGYAELTFDTAISSFGGFFNYAPNNGGDNAFIEVLDASGNSLEMWDLEVSAPISTPNGFNQFEFRGIDLGTNVFTTFRFGGNYILLTGTADGSVVDSVNAPAGLGVMLLGLILLGLRQLKK